MRATLIITGILCIGLFIIIADKNMQIKKPTAEQRCDLLGGAFYPKGDYCILKMKNQQ